LCQGSARTLALALPTGPSVEPAHVPAEVPNPVRAFSLRRFDEATSPATYPAIVVDVEIAMGHSPSSPASYSYDLPANRGADFRTVLRRTVKFPPSQRRADGRYPFAYRFPLEAPFWFQPGSHAVIEFRLLAPVLALSSR
jgi:hypothetical protein